MKPRGLAIGMAVLAAAPSAAHHIAGSGEVNGAPIILFADHTWQFGDIAQKACPVEEPEVRFCANERVWKPSYEKQGAGGLYKFSHDARFSGELKLLADAGGRDVTDDDVLAYLGNLALDGSNQSLQILKEGATLGDYPATTRVFSGGGTVIAATYLLQDGKAVIAITKEADMTIYAADHKLTHQSFVDSIEVGS